MFANEDGTCVLNEINNKRRGKKMRARVRRAKQAIKNNNNNNIISKKKTRKKWRNRRKKQKKSNNKEKVEELEEKLCERAKKGENWRANT